MSASEPLAPCDACGFAHSPLAADAPRLVSFEALDLDVDTLRWELACGYPVVIGVRVFEAFEHVSPEHPLISLPAGEPVGGHALCVVGYDNGRDALLIQNSWGTSWGAQGRAWIPYRYVTNPFWCGELHAVRVVRRKDSLA